MSILKGQNQGNLAVILKTFFSLSSVQFLDMFLPLITIPYVVRIIGIENFGIITFSQAVVGYLVILVNFGFNLTATRDVAINKNAKEKINRIFIDVTFAKLLLLLLSFVVLFFLCVFIPNIGENKVIYYFVFLQLMSQCMIPNFFLQGMQDLKWTSIVAIVSKVISILFIFIFLKHKEDFSYYVMFLSLGSVLSMFYSYVYIWLKYKLSVKSYSVSWENIFQQYKSGFFVFVSQIKITFFNNFNIILVGSLLGNTAAGIFGSADKIIKVLSSIQAPIVTSIFPYFSQLVNENKNAAIKKLNKIAFLGGVLYLIPILIAFLFANEISLFMFGKEAHFEIATLIKIMCIVPLFVFINNLYGTQFLLNMNKKRLYLLSFVIAAFLNISIIYPLTYYWGVIGSSISVVITEVVLCFLMCYFAFLQVKTKHEN